MLNQVIKMEFNLRGLSNLKSLEISFIISHLKMKVTEHYRRDEAGELCLMHTRAYN